MLKTMLAALTLALATGGSVAHSSSGVPFSDGFTLSPFGTTPAALAAATDEQTATTGDVVEMPNDGMATGTVRVPSSHRR